MIRPHRLQIPQPILCQTILLSQKVALLSQITAKQSPSYWQVLTIIRPHRLWICQLLFSLSSSTIPQYYPCFGYQTNRCSVQVSQRFPPGESRSHATNVTRLNHVDSHFGQIYTASVQWYFMMLTRVCFLYAIQTNNGHQISYPNSIVVRLTCLNNFKQNFKYLLK